MPRQVFQLDPGATEFRKLPISGFQKARYDPHRDRIFVQYPGRGVFEWDGKAMVPSPVAAGLEFDDANDILPRYVDGTGGYFAVVDGRFYFRADREGASWERVRLWFQAPDDVWLLASSRTRFAAEQGIVIVPFSRRALVFSVAPGDAPKFQYSIAAKNYADLYHPRHGPSIFVTNGMHVTAGSPKQHQVFVLTSKGAVRASTLLKPLSERPKGAKALIPDRHGYREGLYQPPLFRLAEGWVYYDGTGFYPVPHLSRDALGNYPRWFVWDKRIFVLHQGGWSELLDDLSLVKGHLPIPFRATHEVDIAVSDTHGGIIATYPGEGIWFSADGLSFERIYHGPVVTRSYEADIPDATEGVVLADDGLYLLGRTCDADAVRD